MDSVTLLISPDTFDAGRFRQLDSDAHCVSQSSQSQASLRCCMQCLRDRGDSRDALRQQRAVQLPELLLTLLVPLGGLEMELERELDSMKNESKNRLKPIRSDSNRLIL